MITELIEERVRATRPRKLAPQPQPIMIEHQSSDAETIVVGPLAINVKHSELSISGTVVKLGATEFGILVLLARHAGTALTRQQILDGLHGSRHAISDRAVDVQVTGLRAKLGAHAGLLETVRGIGYRLQLP